MGSLAKYGALVGVGKGLQAIGEQKREERLLEEKDERQAKREEARFNRQQKWQEARDTKEHERAIERAEVGEGLRRETSRIARESDQAFKREQNELDRLSREAIASAKLRGANVGQKRDMMEYLLKGEDINMRNVQDPAGLETITITEFAATGDVYRNWAHSKGSTYFPQGRDPIELASAFPSIKPAEGKGRKGEDAVRSQVLERIMAAENSLMKSVGTEQEQQVLEFFQSKLGYTPLIYQRTKNAQRIIGAFQ